MEDYDMYTYGTENEEIYRDLQDEHFMAVSIDIPSVPGACNSLT